MSTSKLTYSLTRTYSVKIGRLGGAGSDYAAFVQHIGVPAADMLFGGGNKHIVLHAISFYFTRLKK